MSENGRKASRRGSGGLAISKLRSLPEPLFTQVVSQLVGRWDVEEAAIWVLAHPDRGDLRGCSFKILCGYLRAMNREIREWLRYPMPELAPPWLQTVLEKLASPSPAVPQTKHTRTSEPAQQKQNSDSAPQQAPSPEDLLQQWERQRAMARMGEQMARRIVAEAIWPFRPD